MAQPTGITPPVPGSSLWTWVPPNALPDGNIFQQEVANVVVPRDFLPGESVSDLAGLPNYWIGGGWLPGIAPQKPDGVSAPTGGSKEWRWTGSAVSPDGTIIPPIDDPVDVGDANALGLSLGAAWPADEYIATGGGRSYVRWDGTAFVPATGPLTVSATSIAAGTPGSAMPAGAAYRALIDLRLDITVGDGNVGGSGQLLGHAWQPGQYVNLILQPGDPLNAPTGPVYWDGHSWQSGVAPTPSATIINPGTPGSFAPPGATEQTQADINANPYFGFLAYRGHPAWAAGEYIVLGDGTEVFWDGAIFQTGRAGAPTGTQLPQPVFIPTGIAPPAAGSLEWTWQPMAYPGAWEMAQPLTFSPSRNFAKDEYVTDRDGNHFYWDGVDQWVAGDSPGPADMIVAGTPGAWGQAAAGNQVYQNQGLAPLSLGDALATVTLFLRIPSGGGLQVDNSAWLAGEYATLADGTEIFWDGAAWQFGRVGAPVAPPTADVYVGSLLVSAGVVGVYQGATQLWP